MTVFGHTRIGGVVSRPGRYLMRSHYMPFWKVSGGVCLLPGPNGMTWLDAATAGPFSMVASASSSGFVQAATSRFRRFVPGGDVSGEVSHHG